MANNQYLYTIAILSNYTSAKNNLNTKIAIINNALANTLALDGTKPNSMQADLDMNNFNIDNLPLPVNQTSPLRVMDVSLLNGGGTITAYPLPIGGTAGQVLTKTDSGNYDVQWSNPTSISTTGSSSLTLSGSGVLSTSSISGAVTAPANSLVTTLASNVVGNSNLRASVPISVIGNNTNSVSNVADIAGTSNQVLSVNNGGTALGFVSVSGDISNSNGAMTIQPGVVTGSKVATNTVLNSNLSQSTAATLKGNPTASSANVTDFTIQSLVNDSSPDANNDKVLIYNHTLQEH